MNTSGDIAVLKYGDDSKWHWVFLTPSVLSTLAFNASADPILSTFDASGAAAAAQAYAVQRGHHTGTHAASTVSDFSAAAIAAVTWSTLTGKPTIGTQMSVDTGWTAVTATPDKTVVLANYANTLSGAAVTALDALVGASGSGTAINAGLAQVVVLTKEIAALRAALLARLLPNA